MEALATAGNFNATRLKELCAVHSVGMHRRKRLGNNIFYSDNQNEEVLMKEKFLWLQEIIKDRETGDNQNPNNA